MRNVYAHELVVKTAREMAEALYEEVMSGSNDMYSGWKTQFPDKTPDERHAIFVAAMYPKLLEPARAMLAHMLGQKRYEHLHEAIYDSILKDAVVKGSRAPRAPRKKVDVIHD